MAIIRNKSKECFTVISNNIFKDKSLSLKGRGMLVTLLSLPDNWEFSENGLEKIFNDGITAIRSALKELEEKGYLLRTKHRNEKGQFYSEWMIFETSTSENPHWKNRGGKTDSDNHTQLNTNIKEVNNICPSKDEQDSSLKELADNFNKIWDIYPRKEGKNDAFNHYKAWLRGKEYAGKKIKLTNKQMWFAVKEYADLMRKNRTERQFIKMGSTFFNGTIMEYVKENNE